MPIDKDSIQAALARVVHPALNADLVSAGAILKVAYCDGHASVRISAEGLSETQRSALQQSASAAIRSLAKQNNVDLAHLHVELADQPPQSPRAAPDKAHRPAATERPGPDSLPGVRHTIAVGAGKGGVGKSTIAVNLAVGLARRGHSVGLMDGDIYGPSLPTMLGLDAYDVNVRDKLIEPFLVHGIKAMTIGKLVEPDKPLIWRGPMAHSAFRQLVEQTNWGELDYLIIDLPPGTGDVSLTMAQLLRLTGAVVVCTPQKVAQDDAVRAAHMFRSLGIDVLGIVENMSSFIADDINPPREYDLFGKGGAQRMAQRLGLPFLGSVPITIPLRLNSDSGNPEANFAPGTRLAEAFDHLVSSLESQVALASVRQGRSTPTLTIS